jgi:hypothetical protein
MPAIRPYTSQVGADAPVGGREAQASDFGGTGLTQLGTGVQSLGHSIGQAQRIFSQNKMRQEATDADTATMKANAELTVKLQNRARDWKPGDPDFTEAFHAEVKKTFEDLSVGEDGESKFETAQGQRHFDNRAAHYASQFVVEGAKVSAHLSGLQAVADHAAMVDTNANMLQQQPAFFDSTRQETENTINNPDGIYGRIAAVDRQKLIRQSDEALATATVQGMIEQQPTAALAQLQKGWMNTYIPKEKYPVLVDRAQTAVRAIGIEARQAAAEARQQAQDLSRTMDTTLVTQRAAHDADPKQPDVTPKVILHAMTAGLNPEVGRTWLNMLDMESRQGAKAIHTDPGTEHDLFRRIHAKPDAPDKIIDTAPIYDAYLRGRLSPETRRDLVKELTDARDPEGAKLGDAKAIFFDSRKSSITQSNQLLGKMDQQGDTKFGDFKYMVNQKIQEYQKEKKDPHDLFNPSKPDFLGKPEILQQYQTSLTQSMGSISQKLQKATAKLPETLPPEQMRKPGESYGDWKARQK